MIESRGPNKDRIDSFRTENSKMMLMPSGRRSVVRLDPQMMISIKLLLLINLFEFVLFLWDKNQARWGRWRVPERKLLVVALMGGSPAALFAMNLLRHKTVKQSFRNEMNQIVCAQVVLLAFFLYRQIGLKP